MRMRKHLLSSLATIGNVLMVLLLPVWLWTFLFGINLAAVVFVYRAELFSAGRKLIGKPPVQKSFADRYEVLERWGGAESLSEALGRVLRLDFRERHMKTVYDKEKGKTEHYPRPNGD